MRHYITDYVTLLVATSPSMALRHKQCYIIQLLTFVEVNMKCFWTVNNSYWPPLHISQYKVEINMNCLLFNNTSCSPKQKSTIVLLYKKILQSKSLSFTPNFSWHSFTNHATLRSYVTDYATSSIVNLTWLTSGPMAWLLIISHIITSIVVLPWLASKPMKFYLQNINI